MSSRRRIWLAAAAAAAVLALPAPASAAPFVYAANLGSGTFGTVLQYQASAGGVLSPLSPASVAGGNQPWGVAVSPDGRSAYVTNVGGNSVDQFDIGSGGTLSPKTPASIGVASGPFGVVVSPDGRHAYVAASGANLVTQLDVAADGRLALHDPSGVATGEDPNGIAIDPGGRWLYVTNTLSNDVSQYSIGANGTLTPASPPTVDAGPRPSELTVSPDGRSVYVSNTNGTTINQYDVGSGGKLTPKSPATVATGAAPVALRVSPDGTSLYVAGNGTGSVYQYDIGTGGRLAPKSPASVVAGTNPIGLAVTPDGKSVYAANSNGSSISQFDVGPLGRLSAKSPATVAAAGLPVGIAVTPLSADPGLELVTETSGSDSSNKTLAAACPAGKRVLGAGGDIESPAGTEGQVIIDDQRPVSDLRSVFVQALEDEDGNPANWTVAAMAVCAYELPGLERVTNTSPLGSSTKTVTASCPAGKRVVGAGSSINAGNGQVVRDDLTPGSGLTSVTVKVLEDETGYPNLWSATAHAVCAFPVPGLQRVVVTSPLVWGRRSQTAVAPCPAGKRVLGGGADINAGNGQVAMDDIRYDEALHSVTAQASADQTGSPTPYSVTAFAICASL